MKDNINSYFGVDTISYYKTKITFMSLQNVEQLLHDMENDPLVLALIMRIYFKNASSPESLDLYNLFHVS